MNSMKQIIDVFSDALGKSKFDGSKVSMVSDILFSPEAVKKLGVDYFHTTRGSALPFATGLKLGNLDLKVLVPIGDLLTIGGNHFIHSARGNMDLVVVYLNHFIYKRVGGEKAPAFNPRISLYPGYEEPFNIPHLAKSFGAEYVARWTVLHTRELADSIAEAMQKRGFSVIEVISPGVDYFLENRSGDELFNFAEYYYKNSEIRNEADTKEVDIGPEKKIVVGKFVDRERETFIDSYNRQLAHAIGDKFGEYK
ncbi:2-oxoacid:ferredoxin oxidoreductase subunit beta [bacterium]|nr:2-oxoacid:ferredoxin oxidoreductase subunit beta [bacterium]